MLNDNVLFFIKFPTNNKKIKHVLTNLDMPARSNNFINKYVL